MTIEGLIRFCLQEIKNMEKLGYKDFSEKVYYDEIIKRLKELKELKRLSYRAFELLEEIAHL